jgi:hypothetical protein
LALLAFIDRISLVPPLVAVVWAITMGFSHQLPPNPHFLALLFSSTWIIYIVDRLVESDTHLLRDRHHFFQSANRQWSLVVVTLLLLNAVVLWRDGLPPHAHTAAAGVVSGSLFYLGMARYWKRPSPAKEWIKNALTSWVFATACAIPTLATKGSTATFPLHEIFPLALLVLLNLRIHESIEARSPSVNVTELILTSALLVYTLTFPTLLNALWALSALLMLLVKVFARTQPVTKLLDFSLLLFPLLALVFITPTPAL